MSGSFQKSKNVSDSSSQSSQVGGNAATSFGVGGSSGVSDSLSQSQSGQSIAFQDLFQQLFGGANAAAQAVNANGISGAANQLFTGGTNFLQSLTQNAGTDALQARIGDTSARDTQLGALKTQLGDFFNEQVIPGINSQGIAAGTFGGSRDAVAQSMAAKAVGGQFAQGAASIIGTDQAQRDQAAAQLGQLNVQGGQAGLSSLSSLYGLAQGGATAGLVPYQLLAQIMGGPTVLGQSSSSSIAKAISDSFNNQGSQSYGFDFGSSSSLAHSQGSAMGISGGIGQSSTNVGGP
jgi:hypothetical protein